GRPQVLDEDLAVAFEDAGVELGDVGVVKGDVAAGGATHGELVGEVVDLAPGLRRLDDLELGAVLAAHRGPHVAHPAAGGTGGGRGAVVGGHGAGRGRPSADLHPHRPQDADEEEVEKGQEAELED